MHMRTSVKVGLFGCLGGLLAGSPKAADTEWPGFRGPNHDGKSPDTGLLKEWPAGGPALLWKAEGIGSGFSSAAISGGKIYVTGDVDGAMVIAALDLDGKPLWQTQHGPAWGGGPTGARNTVTLDAGNLYLLSGTGALGCFDAATGQPKWTRDAKEFGGSPGGWGYAESVLIDGDLAVFKPGGPTCIVALDKTTGKDVWRSQGYSAGPEYTSCLPFTFEQVPMIVTGTQAGLVCVRAKDGQMLWSDPFCAGNVANCPTPAFSDGYIFWSNGYGKGGICMKLEPGGTAKEAWRTSELICHHGGYVIEGGFIYGNHEGGWTCLDLRTGVKKWFDKGVGKGSLCWADGMLYLFSENGGEAALATCSPEGLLIKGRVKVEGKGPSWAHPVVSGGRLYLRYDTTLYCFNVKP
jgi:outer membrane protein assembly factor BamB